MKHKISKKVISLLLSIAMVLTFFPAQAFAASALTPQEAVAQAIKDSGFTATVKDSTVTVTGSVTNKNSSITIDIPDGVTVDWQATLSGDGGHNNSGVLSGQSSLLNLTGNGDFILDSSGKITCSGSTVVAIGAIGPDLTIRGQVSSVNHFAIFALLTTDITVEGGLVQSQSSNAIYLGKDGTTVTVTGGSVLSIAPEPFAIAFDFSINNKHVFITGGSVKGSVDAQPTDKDSNPVYLVPVKVSNAGGVCDISAYLVNNGMTYEAQTDADGNAYLWLPAGTATISAETESKYGSTQVTVTSTNSTANITVTTPEEDVAAAITDYNTGNGGTGTLTAAINGSTVTVTGSLAGVTKTLKLDVPQDVKVLWKAKLTGTGTVSGAPPHPPLLEIVNSGTVEIAEGAEIINSASKTSAVVSSGGNLIMSGGKVTSTGSPGIAIAAGSGCKFLMSGGEVTANQATSFAIEGSIGTIALTGGTISASGNNGVQLLLDGTFAAYRSGMIQPGSIQSPPGSGLSAAVSVDQALISTAPGMATGLTLKAYNLPDGDSLALQWVPRYDGIGINIYKLDDSKSWFVGFPGVKLVVPGSTHTVFYDANGGSGTMNHEEVDDDADYTVAANGFTFSGYSFAGWNTQADGSGTAYPVGAVIAGVQNDITLYAQWNAKGIPVPGPKYTVSYNTNGGSGAINSAKVDIGSDYIVVANSFTRSNYSFAGWNTQADGSGTAYLAGTKISCVQNDITLFAQWTYLGENGSGTGKSGTKKTDSVIPAAGATMVKDGTITTSTGTFVTDTTADVHVRGGYTVKLTSDNGRNPNVFIGTPGVFEVQLTTVNGKDYFVKLIPVGQPGAQAGVYLDGVKLFVATVETPVSSSAVKSDTTRPFHVKSGASYVMKLTASSRPVLVSGTAGAFKVEFIKVSGSDYLFRITPIGKIGVSSGLYVNSEKSPVAVATVA